MADIALAGRVIASHYAEPIDRQVTESTQLKSAPATDAPTICDLDLGEPFALLDDSLGWAWGYAGKGRRVGYVRSEALTSA